MAPVTAFWRTPRRIRRRRRQLRHFCRRRRTLRHICRRCYRASGSVLPGRLVLPPGVTGSLVVRPGFQVEVPRRSGGWDAIQIRGCHSSWLFSRSAKKVDKNILYSVWYNDNTRPEYTARDPIMAVVNQIKLCAL